MSAASELPSDFSFCRLFMEFYVIVMRMRDENKTMVLKCSGIHPGDRCYRVARLSCVV